MTEHKDTDFGDEVARKASRRLKARSEKDRGVWFGLGMFGLVGWTVAIPSVIGLGVGVWVDSRSQSRYSWAIMGLCIGLILGCIGAWRWVKRESETK